MRQTQILCPDNTCAPVCATINVVVESDANHAPALALRTHPELLSFVNVTKGASYSACGVGEQPLANAPCELGASASDQEDGDLSYKVGVTFDVSCLA